MSGALERLNALGTAAAVHELLGFCGSREWARRMARSRPFPDLGSLVAEARRTWEELAVEDRLEAFAAHPRIGDARASGREAGEQAGARSASPETLRGLAEGNRRFEEKFGHVFLICASGRRGSEMLVELKKRLENDPETERRLASEEQRKITQLRLEKAFGG